MKLLLSQSLVHMKYMPNRSVAAALVHCLITHAHHILQLSSFDMVSSLAEAIAKEHSGLVPPTTPSLDMLSPGVLVCAKYSVDGCYYRAQVLGWVNSGLSVCTESAVTGCEGQQVQVQYIDHGNITSVGITDLFLPTTPLLLQTPPQVN